MIIAQADPYFQTTWTPNWQERYALWSLAMKPPASRQKDRLRLLPRRAGEGNARVRQAGGLRSRRYAHLPHRQAARRLPQPAHHRELHPSGDVRPSRYPLDPRDDRPARSQRVPIPAGDREGEPGSSLADRPPAQKSGDREVGRSRKTRASVALTLSRPHEFNRLGLFPWRRFPEPKSSGCALTYPGVCPASRGTSPAP